MWRSLSLRSRINFLVGLVLALGLAANVARLLMEARPRVQAEDQSVIRLTRELIASIKPGLDAAPDADRRLDQIVADLTRLRHVSIQRGGEGAVPGDATESVPGWFVALIHPERISISVPVTIGGKDEQLRITSLPGDEMQEIWDGIVTQLTLGGVIALVLFVVTSQVVRRALAPIDALSQAMIEIEAGHYQARVTPRGAPELAALCERLNHLALTLGAALEDRRRLAERSVSLQDQERKEIGRELHDEFGPHLFALRAHAGAVLRLAERDAAAGESLQRHGAAILAQVDALQQFNRRLLERLRPPGLVDLGLVGAIDALLRLWRDTDPNVRVTRDISPMLGRLDEAAELTAYRVVQEGLTNAFRHSRATEVSITIAPVAQNDAVMVRIGDNGSGLDPSGQPGFGLIGMRERVWALGGELKVTSRPGGVVIDAVIPAAASAGSVAPQHILPPP